MGSRKQARESILASKEAIDQLMFLAGAPREIWRDVALSLPAPTSDVPPEQGRGADDPFAEVARSGYSFEEQRKWLGYIEGQIEYLASLALGAYPESSFEHRRARWTAIRLRVLLNRRLCRLGLQAL
jgi:hypothetical protein